MELPEIIRRVDAMNSYLRSEANRRGHSSWLNHIVYFYKLECIERCRFEGCAEHKRVTIRTTCRDCAGSGRYTDNYGFEHDHCWACRNIGNVTLDFLETTVPGAVWLTPTTKAWGFMGHDQFQQLPESEKVWAILQIGNDLTASEVADHLCEIEAFFPRRPQSFWGRDHQWDPYATYTLWLGRAPHQGCFLCGWPIGEYGGHVTRTGRLHWSARVCQSCSDKGMSTFEAISARLPESMLTPEIRRWVERHPVQERKAA